MKRINKYLSCMVIGVGILLLYSAPAIAQRGARGGGGGGGHFSGGGFSGGRASVSAPHFNSGVRTGMAPRFNSGFRNNFAGRSSFGVRSGFSPGRRTTGFSGYRSGISARNGFRSGQRAMAYRPGYSGGRGFASGQGAMAYRHGRYGFGGVQSYRPGYHGAGIYGHGGMYGNYSWHRHHDFFYNQGYYGSLYYPMLGLGFWDLPYGYYPFWWNDDLYYFDDGLFYQYDNDQYTVVEPPVGAEIDNLPSDAQSIVINGQQFYELNGVYYQPITKDDGSQVYEVAGKDGELNTGSNGTSSVEPHIGDIITQLPADCHKIKLNGSVFYVSVDGIYYQEIKDANGNAEYQIVALDSGSQSQ